MIVSKTLLIIEDDPGLQSQMRWCFNDDVEVHMASDRETAISLLRRYEPAVVTLDLGLPPDPGGSSEGFKVLEEILQLAPKTKVIVVTGREENAYAVKAVGMGATDFFQKPLDADILNFVVERAFNLAQLETENSKLKSAQSNSGIPGVIANSPSM
ncbi:response regulator, partial [Oleiphilus sp. HI0066]|uniref:response regulator n=3 Tax=Oleiphilus TaxID=141450 RepID=UPI0012E8279E